jgi:sarcosine oxidase
LVCGENATKFVTSHTYGWPHGQGGPSQFGGGEFTTAEGIRREVTEADVAGLRAGLAETVPELSRAPLASGATRLYTNTPDLNFAIGAPPSSARDSLAAGFSGHWFKFSPVVGEVLADVAESGESQHPIEAFDPRRFAAHQSGGKGISGSGGTPTASADITSPIT